MYSRDWGARRIASRSRIDAVHRAEASATRDQRGTPLLPPEPVPDPFVEPPPVEPPPVAPPRPVPVPPLLGALASTRRGPASSVLVWGTPASRDCVRLPASRDTLASLCASAGDPYPSAASAPSVMMIFFM